MEDANFRKLYPEKNRNDEYDVDSNRCDDVLSDIERQENFINTVKEDTQKSDKQKKAVECNQRTQNENDAGATHRHF